MYVGQVVLLVSFFKATIIRKFDIDNDNDNRWIAGYYNNDNRYKMTVITDSDIILNDEDHYGRLRKRHNKINRLFK